MILCKRAGIAFLSSHLNSHLFDTPLIESSIISRRSSCFLYPSHPAPCFTTLSPTSANQQIPSPVLRMRQTMGLRPSGRGSLLSVVRPWWSFPYRYESRALTGAPSTCFHQACSGPGDLLHFLQASRSGLRPASLPTSQQVRCPPYYSSVPLQIVDKYQFIPLLPILCAERDIETLIMWLWLWMKYF